MSRDELELYEQTEQGQSKLLALGVATAVGFVVYKYMSGSESDREKMKAWGGKVWPLLLPMLQRKVS